MMAATIAATVASTMAATIAGMMAATIAGMMAATIAATVAAKGRLLRMRHRSQTAVEVSTRMDGSTGTSNILL